MLENERIIVQDRGGIDAGIAALMQNANKGFDPAALMAIDELYSCTSCLNINQDIWAAMRVAHIL